jgi:hypothetical protein
MHALARTPVRAPGGHLPIVRERPAMARRRNDSATHDPRRASDRIEESLAHLTGRFEQLAVSLDGRLGRIEKDVATGALGQQQLRTEMDEARRDASELRDGLAKLREDLNRFETEQPRKVAEGAAHGAAAAVVETAAPATAQAVTKSVSDLFKRWGVVGAIGAGVVWLFTEAPAVVRGLDAFWTMLKGLNQ